MSTARLDASSTPAEVRQMCREGRWRGHTAGLAAGYAQANLVIVPKDLALDFLVFAQRNPKACPVMEVGDVGNPILGGCAGGADVRTDLPRYRVFRDGVPAQEGDVSSISDLWREDMVAIALGCSFSFEAALLAAGLPVRHQEEGKNVPMYRTTRPCRPAGRFHGNLVVSMRPMTPAQAIRATEVTARYPRVHGSPVHVGDPSALGIRDGARPDFGDPVTVREGEVCVFWACGVTPQVAVMESEPPLCITHAPGHMLVLDAKNAELAV